jgi:branched-chain amino acid transport system substrate-binding protein
VGSREFAWGAASSIALLLLLASASVSRAQSKGQIEVGSVAGLTGYLATYDGNFVNGLKLGVKTINDAGGVGGRKIDLHIVDGASNATAGVTGVNQLLNQYGVIVFLNGASSATTAAISPITADAEVPVITLSQLPPQPKWVFESTTDFAAVTTLELDFAAKVLKAKKIGIIYNQTPAAQKGTETLKALAPKWGLEVVSVQGVATDATDLTPQLSAFKEAKPDAILDFMTGPAHILGAKAASTVGLDAALVMGLDDTSTFQQASKVYPNAYLSAIPVQVYPDISDPDLKKAVGEFLDAYHKAGLDPAGVQAAASGWDAPHIVAAAVKVSGATTGTALRKAIESLDYQGVVTRWRFSAQDHTGQANSNSLQIVKYENDKLKVVFRAGGK